MNDNSQPFTELQLTPIAAGASSVDAGLVSAPDGRLTVRDGRGMVSAEWAVGIIAAIAIAGVLLAVVTSGPVQDALLDFILKVIHSFSGFFNK